MLLFFFFQAEDGIRDLTVTGVQTCALPISMGGCAGAMTLGSTTTATTPATSTPTTPRMSPVLLRSEEHTSELQSQSNLVCRLLLEKKKKTIVSKLTTLTQSSMPQVQSHDSC